MREIEKLNKLTLIAENYTENLEGLGRIMKERKTQI